MANVRYKVIEKNGSEIVQEIHKVVVHTIKMSDCEDPDIMVAEPMWNWQQSDQGKFVMENAIETPSWHRHYDTFSYGHIYAIVAELDSKKLAEFYLKWGKSNGSNQI